MSVTTTSNPVTSSVLHVLMDYELHHSGSSERTKRPEPLESRDNPTLEVLNPAGWPTDHRRVPHYRPINRNLYMEERPGGLDPMEAIFIMTMLNGVRLNAVRTSQAMISSLTRLLMDKQS
jgi:hypothetical protein